MERKGFFDKAREMYGPSLNLENMLHELKKSESLNDRIKQVVKANDEERKEFFEEVVMRYKSQAAKYPKL